MTAQNESYAHQIVNQFAAATDGAGISHDVGTGSPAPSPCPAPSVLYLRERFHEPKQRLDHYHGKPFFYRRQSHNGEFFFVDIYDDHGRRIAQGFPARADEIFSPVPVWKNELSVPEGKNTARSCVLPAIKGEKS